MNKILLCFTSKKQQNSVANSLGSRLHGVPCCVRPAAAGPPRTHWFALPSCPDSAAPLEGGEDTLNSSLLLRCHVSQRVQRLRERLTPSVHGCKQSLECLETFILHLATSFFFFSHHQTPLQGALCRFHGWALSSVEFRSFLVQEVKMQLRTVLDVNVVDVQKRRNPSKHYVSLSSCFCLSAISS